MQTLHIVHPSDVGQRIDRFCKKYFPNAALGGIYRMLRTGKIKVNGKKKDQTYKIEQNDEITFWISDDEIAELRNINSQSIGIPWSSFSSTKKEIHWSQHILQSNILYEDQYLIVYNKPAWLNVHAGDHKTNESNLIDQIQDYLQGKYDSLTFRPALVHRIDRDTSWCILIAKDKNVLELLLSDLQSHKIEKIYHALVIGKPLKNTDTIRKKLLRVENAHSEAKVRVDQDWQNAITHFHLLHTYHWNKADDQYSILECRIETGRTHQIRVHLASIDCPILGDKAYWDKKINSYCARQYAVQRQMLHAQSLIFCHPITRKLLKIEAPYMEDFQYFISLIDTRKS